MKKIIIAVAIVMASYVVQAQVKTPQSSPKAVLSQVVGLTDVVVEYSRPSAKGRAIFGDLVPFENVWRTGANSATTLTFGEEVTIGDKKVAAGKYGLLSIPSKNNWILIISKQLDVTSPSAYKAESDVVRINLTPVTMANKVETFTMQFANVKSSSCELNLQWENTSVSLPISTDVDSKVMKQIENIMTKDNLPYYNAAMYYMESGKDLKQALSWFNKATEQSPTAYYMFYQKANCLVKLGKKEEAIATATKSLALAKAGKNPDYVKLNEDLLKTLK